MLSRRYSYSEIRMNLLCTGPASSSDDEAPLQLAPSAGRPADALRPEAVRRPLRGPLQRRLPAPGRAVGPEEGPRLQAVEGLQARRRQIREPAWHESPRLDSSSISDLQRSKVGKMDENHSFCQPLNQILTLGKPRKVRKKTPDAVDSIRTTQREFQLTPAA